MSRWSGPGRAPAVLLAALCASWAVAGAVPPSTTGARAQTGPAERAVAPVDAQCRGKDLRSRVIPVRFKPVAEAAALVDHLLSPCGAYSAPKMPKEITVTDEPGPLRKISEALALWDVPPRAVDVTVTLILASRDVPGAPPCPPVPGLSPTLAQLTRFSCFQQLGAATTRAMEGNETQARLDDTHWVKFTIEGVDSARAVVQLASFDLYRNAAPNEGPASQSLPRRLLGLLELKLPEGRESLVGAPGRGGERVLFVALKAASVPAAQATAAGPGR